MQLLFDFAVSSPRVCGCPTTPPDSTDPGTLSSRWCPRCEKDVPLMGWYAPEDKWCRCCIARVCLRGQQKFVRLNFRPITIGEILSANWIVGENTPRRAYMREFVKRRRAALAVTPGYDYTTNRHISMRWAMWGGLCWVCGVKAEATDHVIPLSRGGTHWPANLRPICKVCNSSKNAKTHDPGKNGFGRTGRDKKIPGGRRGYMRRYMKQRRAQKAS